MKTLFNTLLAIWAIAVTAVCIVLLKEKKSFFSSYFRGRRRNHTILQINDNFDRDLRDLLVDEEKQAKARSMKNHPTANPAAAGQPKAKPRFGVDRPENETMKNLEKAKAKRDTAKPGSAWREEYYLRYLNDKKNKHDDLD